MVDALNNFSFIKDAEPVAKEKSSGASVSSSVEDGASTTPRIGSYGWGDAFLEQVPFEEINKHFLISACKFATRVTRSSNAARSLMLGLPRSGYYSDEEAAPFIKRMDAGDCMVLSETLLFDQQELAAPLAQLFAYARNGEGPGRNPEESREAIERLLEHHRSLISDSPESLRNAMPDSFPWLVDTLAAAEARWATDNGLPVTVDGLSALAGVKSKTVSNLVAAKTLPIDSDGFIPAAAALVWLLSRKDFVASWWQTDEHGPSSPAEAVAEARLNAQVFVPIDSDGQPFLPSLARRSKAGTLRYIVGEKASPEYVEDYWEALRKLEHMQTPRWRRPNPFKQGGWGLVSGQDGWRRYSRTDIERMVEAVRRGEEC